MTRNVREWLWAILAVCLFSSIAATAALAGEPTFTWGPKRNEWLLAGNSLNLGNGHLHFDGSHFSAPGIREVQGLDEVPTEGYQPSVQARENSIYIVALGGGNYALVQTGLGWRTGLAGATGASFSSIDITWSLSVPAPAPAPAPPAPPAPTPDTQPAPPAPPAPAPEAQPAPEPEPGPVTALTGTGRLVYTTRREVRLYDLATASDTLLFDEVTLTGRDTGVPTGPLRVRPDGLLLALSGQPDLWLADPRGQAVYQRDGRTPALSVQGFSPDGQQLVAVAGWDWLGAEPGRLVRVDLATGAETVLAEEAFSATWTTQGILYDHPTADFRTAVSLLNPDTGEVLPAILTLEGFDRRRLITASADGSLVAATDADGQVVSLYAPGAAPRVVWDARKDGGGQRLELLHLSDDGERLLLLDQEGHAWVRFLASDHSLKLPFGVRAFNAAWLPATGSDRSVDAGTSTGTGASASPQADPAPVAEPAPAPAPVTPAPVAEPAPASAPVTPELRVNLQVGNRTATVNGVGTLLDVPPQLIGGRTLVPLRFLVEALGANLEWEGTEQRITITAGARKVVIWVDRPQAIIDGVSTTLDVPPTILDGRTMVPLRFVSENLSADLAYNPDDQSIVITRGATAAPPVPDPLPSPAADDGAVHFAAVFITDEHVTHIPVPTVTVFTSAQRPDFYLTLRPDGTARAVWTILHVSGPVTMPVNIAFSGTYTRGPFRATLALEPPLPGWDTLFHHMDDLKELTVTGDLAADMSGIANLVIEDRAAQSGSAWRVTEAAKASGE